MYAIYAQIQYIHKTESNLGQQRVNKKHGICILGPQYKISPFRIGPTFVEHFQCPSEICPSDYCFLTKSLGVFDLIYTQYRHSQIALWGAREGRVQEGVTGTVLYFVAYDLQQLF